MVSEFSRKRNNLGIKYGFIAGLFFTLSAWGMDALILARHNNSLPLLKLLPALFICIPAAILVAHLTARSESGIVGLILWGGLAVLLTFLVINLPLKFAPWYLSKVNPELITVIKFEDLIGFEGYWFYCLFAIGLSCMLCGFLENVIIDQGLASSSLIGPHMPLIICGVIMLLSGLFGDLLMTRDFRKQVVALDIMLENAAIYYNQDIDDRLERELRLGAAKPLGDLVLEPYSLTLVATDRYLTLGKVLVRFNDQVALCQTVYSNPTFCQMLSLTFEEEGGFVLTSPQKIRVDSGFDDIIGFSNFPKTLTT